MVNFNLTGEFKNEIAQFKEIKDLTQLDYKMNCDIVETRGENKKRYYNYPNTFDIESTTINCEKPYGFMYIFMLHYNGFNVCGRRWEEFIQFIDNVKNYNDSDTTVVIYVHFLAYEFQFIKDFFEWERIFAIDAHKVLRCNTDNVEFRCSYYLSNMNLEKFCQSGKNVKYVKQTGHFNYKKIRTCETVLTNEELTYCYCDVMGLHERLMESLEEDTVISIPYTSTGYVRRNCRNAMRKNRKNRELFLKTALNKETYTLLKEAMRGGNTHGNSRHVNVIYHNVKCFDISSSYPAVMMMKYYPVSVFQKGNPKTKEDLKKYLDKYCCLFRLHLVGVKLKKEIPVPYLSEHKCYKKKEELCFNGRIIEAEILSTTVTEIDFKIIMEQYEIEKYAISDFYFAERGQLPKELKDEIMQYYYNKTTLKKSDPYMYAKSKNLLNAIFGMACTDPVRDVALMDSAGEWRKETPDIEESLEDYYNSRNSFLPYQWGIWVTAHAREQLEKSLRLTGNATIYVDTDSNKCVGVESNVLEKLNTEIKKEAVIHNAYVDFNGKRYYMGIFEEEDTCDEFVTKGAKKYAHTENGKFGITISGVSKTLGALEMERVAEKEGTLAIDQFKDGFIFKDSGRTTHYYNNEKPHKITVNDVTFLTASNIGIIDATYTLNTTKSFKEFLETYLDKLM